MALGLSAQGHKREKVSIDETQVNRYWKNALAFASGPQKGFFHGRRRIRHHDLWPWALRPKATNVKRSLLMKHRLVFLGPLAPGHKCEKVSIDQTQVSVSWCAVFGRYWENMLSASLRANKRGNLS